MDQVFEDMEAGRFFIVSAERKGRTDNDYRSEVLAGALEASEVIPTWHEAIGMWDGDPETSFVITFGADVDDEPIRRAVRALGEAFQQEAIIDRGSVSWRPSSGHSWITEGPMPVKWADEVPYEGGATIIGGRVMVLD